MQFSTTLSICNANSIQLEEARPGLATNGRMGEAGMWRGGCCFSSPSRMFTLPWICNHATTFLVFLFRNSFFPCPVNVRVLWFFPLGFFPPRALVGWFYFQADCKSACFHVSQTLGGGAHQGRWRRKTKWRKGKKIFKNQAAPTPFMCSFVRRNLSDSF